MRNILMGLLFSSVVFCSACVRSVNPFFTDDVKVDCKAIKGSWQMVDNGNTGKSSNLWYFSDEQIRTCSDKGAPGVLKVIYFKIGDGLFMDTTADDVPEGKINEWWQLHTLPVHFVSKIELNGDDMTVKPLNNEWFKENLKDSGLDTAMIKTNEYDSLATDITSSDWVKFLKKYAQDDKAFSGKAKYVFKRDKQAGGAKMTGENKK